MKKILLAIIVPLSIMSCNKEMCPTSNNVGSQDLNAATTALDAYKGYEILQFKNDAGNSIILTNNSGRTNLRTEVCVKVKCHEPLKYGGGVTCETIAAEYRNYIFNSAENDIIYNLSFFIENNSREEKKLYEMMQMTISKSTAQGSGRILTYNHTTDVIDVTNNNTANELKLLSSFNWGGKLFTNVYTNNQSADKIHFYYTALEGLIGWQEGESKWYKQ